MVLCRVLLLDGSDYEVQVDQNALGQELFDKVCDHLNLLENDFFGCFYREKETKFWLRLDKKISKQIGGSWVLTFGVKYYTPYPSLLKEELTRYLLFLQLRTDINAARLPTSFITQALLGSYAAQSEIGDHAVEDHGEGTDYIKSLSFGPGHTEELLDQIADLHKTHRGDSPAMAELAYLENAKNLAMYGVHTHPVKDENGNDFVIGVCAIGLLLYKDRLRTNRFSWAKMIKISYKRDKFLIKLRPEENERKGDTLTYKLPDVPRAKQLWRLAMEHHIFFRMREPQSEARKTFSRAGGFKFTGRTYYQCQLAAGQIQRTGPEFIRGSSTRFTSTKSLYSVGNSAACEREEKHIAEVAHPAATLNIRKQGSSAYGYDVENDDRDQPYFMVAGQLVDRYGQPVDQGPNGHPLTSARPIDGYYDQDYPPYSGIGATGYPNGYDPYPPHGSIQSGSRTNSPASGEMSPNQHGYQIMQPIRDKFGNVVIAKNPNRQNESFTSSQDDRLMEQGYRPGMVENGDWDQGHTTTRTYTVDGTVVTEYRTERNGVITTRVEKRTRQEMNDYEEFDYDAALASAIHAVTNMNPDLAVEKIEIHTKAEETMT